MATYKWEWEGFQNSSIQPHIYKHHCRERDRGKGGGRKWLVYRPWRKHLLLAPHIWRQCMDGVWGCSHTRGPARRSHNEVRLGQRLWCTLHYCPGHTQHTWHSNNTTAVQVTHLAHLSKKQKLRVKKLKVLAFLRGLLESSHWWREPEETRTHLLEGQSLAEASSWRSLVAESRPRPSPLRGRI